MKVTEREITCVDMVCMAKDRLMDDVEGLFNNKPYCSLVLSPVTRDKLRKRFEALALPDDEWSTLSTLRNLGYWNGYDDTFWEGHPQPEGYLGQ